MNKIKGNKYEPHLLIANKVGLLFLEIREKRLFVIYLPAFLGLYGKCEPCPMIRSFPSLSLV